MDNLISIELTFDEWNKVLASIHTVRILATNYTEIEEYKDIHESIYNQMKLDIYQQVKKEADEQ